MRYGIFSDIHSNLEAFQQAIDHFKAQSIDRLICLGDVVGYGANPAECLKLLEKITPYVIAGNHEWAVTGKLEPEALNWHAKEAILWTSRRINKHNWKYLRSLPLTYQEDDFYCVHGSLNEPEDFNYIMNSHQAQINFSRLNKQICFIGHSHIAEAFCLDRGQIHYLQKKMINLEKNKKYTINVGSIGQPRDRDPRLSLCLYDSKKKSLEFKRIRYNTRAAADKIAKSGLPQFLAQRLYVGI